MPHHTKYYYISKTRLWLYGFSTIAFTVIGLAGLIFDTSGDKLIYGMSAAVFGFISVLFIRQLSMTKGPFLIIRSDELELHYHKASMRIPRSDIVAAKIIKQRVSGGRIKHVCLQLTESGYNQYLSKQKEVTKFIANSSESYFPDFKNTIVLPGTIEKRNEIVKVVNNWLK